MRVIVIGASGTIGRHVADQLEAHHEVLRASRSADLAVDLEDPDSIARMYERAGAVDAVVCAAGAAKLGTLDTLRGSDFTFSIRSKLMGQIALVTAGLERVSDGGAFVLTTGELARHPIKGCTAVATVNAGLEGFVRAAALELPRGIRINAVSPGWVRETRQALGMDPTPGTPAHHVATWYATALERPDTGYVYDPEAFE
jgi:NAD(P)-dependent dehydrogenase (short-subunit alcohol dehydrogenase family)